MNYFDVLKVIKKKQFSPVYFLFGTETFLIDSIKYELITYSLDDEDRDTNISNYDLEETSIQEVIADAETYPFFGERKIIFASNPSFLKAKPDKTAVEHDLDSLASYLLHPVDYSIIVLIAPYEKIDERKKITKVLKQNSNAISCQSLKDWELDQWITTMAKNEHVSFEKDVIGKLVQEIGPNLMMIKQEMEKMATFVGVGGTITKQIADQLVSHQLTTSGLKLVDAVIEKDLNVAISIFKDLERMGEDPIALLALLASQFRTILHVKLLKQKGYTQSQMAQQLKIHPYVIKMSMSREKSFVLSDLKQAINSCTETDAKIKQGRMDKSLAFELLLYELIHLNKKQGISF
ncbi:DNA polymerase III subunit delta [Aquibacillus salsiterrae]|uniref:DNA polymerase III subunit delta n=1 Tax=Aquibacillus salsiterrae TaxID=2950439 RepID=A0A9X3WAI4_9BACI|nr:DNA polymerase III subunit delta [Aquibacillus salsiterrae]MDC3415580.1 DNA polymerase III subunit delta [Aquibacillus salsiterrae]